MVDELEKHFTAVVPGITGGRVVPLLGAGVNTTSRTEDTKWTVDGPYLPTGRELFEHLATTFEYPPPELGGGWDYDLPRLAEYIEAIAGRGTLYDELRTIFAREYEPTVVHRFLARVPGSLRAKGDASYHQLVVTANYDDLMEQAFAEAGEPFDVVWYLADGRSRGKFIHRRDGGEVRLIDDIVAYRDVNLEKRSVVLKLHGSIDRYDRDRDAYVLTINDYLEYLTRADISALLPPELVDKLYRSHFLFLGYSLRDWNLQVILHRIWGSQELATKSWAVLYFSDAVDRLLWGKRNVDLVNHDLRGYVDALNARVDERLGHV